MALPKHLGGHFHVNHLDHGALEWAIKRFGCRSFLDIGCGLGKMVQLAAERGLVALGVDGDYTLQRYNSDRFVVHDYTTGPSPLEGSFDLGWSVEFVEHVDEAYLDNFCQDFRRCKVLIITHAPPGWGGHHHVNCQPAEYWIAALGKYGLRYDAALTREMRQASTMNLARPRQQFIRNRGLVFIREDQPATVTSISTSPLKDFRMEPLKELEGKTVALIAMGASQVDYAMALQNSKTWDETWCVNSAAYVYRCDRVFMMDPAGRFLDDDKAGTQVGAMREVLSTFEGPIYSCCLDARVPALVEFPLREVIEAFQCPYLNNTCAYAVAFALWNKVARLDLFGLDYTYKHDRHLAEAGRGCVEFWLSKCISAGIKIRISPRCVLLDANVPPQERLYGYHRLADPMLAFPGRGGSDQWLVEPQSKMVDLVRNGQVRDLKPMEPPEPLDSPANKTSGRRLRAQALEGFNQW